MSIRGEHALVLCSNFGLTALMYCEKMYQCLKRVLPQFMYDSLIKYGYVVSHMSS
jgi:hypothetical protein